MLVLTVVTQEFLTSPASDRSFKRMWAMIGHSWAALSSAIDKMARRYGETLIRWSRETHQTGAGCVYMLAEGLRYIYMYVNFVFFFRFFCHQNRCTNRCAYFISMASGKFEYWNFAIFFVEARRRFYGRLIVICNGEFDGIYWIRVVEKSRTMFVWKALKKRSCGFFFFYFFGFVNMAVAIIGARDLWIVLAD